MARKVILSADATCDIGAELQQRYDVQFFNYHIQIGEKSYVDKLEIQPEELYRAWREEGILPKTAAVTPAEYFEFFRQWVEDGCEVVHVNLGSGLSSSYQNCSLAAQQLGSVYPVDSASLSTGSGQLVVEAGKLIAEGKSAAEVQQALNDMRTKTSASFVLDTLEFMAAGGRCSSVTAFGANLLKLKPCILVNNRDGGRMGVGKKYRGPMERVLADYVKDQLAGRSDVRTERLFITHSGSPAADIELVRAEVARYQQFDEVFITEASGTISSHCGPRTLGVLFLTQ